MHCGEYVTERGAVAFSGVMEVFYVPTMVVITWACLSEHIAFLTSDVALANLCDMLLCS